MINIIAPQILNNKCIKATRFAFIEALKQAKIEVEHVPMFCPKIIGIAELYVISPVVANACNKPIVADELWTIAVKITPNKNPKIGLDNFERIDGKTTFELAILILSTIDIIPVKIIPKPRKIFPNIDLFKSIKIKPIIIKIGARVEGVNIENKPKFLSSANLKSWDVIVVPMFAPIIIGTELFKSKILEFTRLIKITVVADELCNNAVIKIPKNKAFNGWFAADDSILLNL